MAYLFQGGNTAVMSGSLIQEGTLEGQGIQSVGALSGSGKLQIGGTVQLDGVADAAVAVGSDFLYYRDSDLLMKRDSIADFATAQAGNGLAASSGVFALDLNELSAATIDVAADSFPIIDATDNSSKKESIADLAAGMCGTVTATGLAASSGVVSVAIHSLGAEQIATGDKIMFSDSDDNGLHYDTIDDIATLFAGSGMAASSAVISVVNATNGGLAIAANDMKVDLVDLAAAAVDVGADSIAIIDANDSDASRKESIADLATAQAGLGLAASSGVFALDLNELTAEAIASGDFLAFVDSTDNGTHKESVDDLAALFAGNGLSASSAVMAVDLNELSAAAVDVSADSIAIIDANDSNGSRKESIADLVAAMAGTGLTAAAGVLNLSSTGGVNGIGDAAATLAEGTNYGTTTLTADRIWTLPASGDMSVGDKVIIKAPNDVSTFKIEIKCNTSQKIDGSTASVYLESDNAAVTMIYVTTNKWAAI